MRAALRDHALDDAVSVLLDDVEGHAECPHVIGQHVLRKSRLLLVEIDGDQLEMDRRAALERQQHVQQRVRILAARKAHHDRSPGLIIRSRRSPCPPVCAGRGDCSRCDVGGGATLQRCCGQAASPMYLLSR